MPRFCRFCGKALRNTSARFCPACGRRLAPTGAPAPGGQEQPHLVIRVPGQPQREVYLDRAAFTVGRDPDNDVVLSPSYVSSHHGRVERRGSAWHYMDLGSTNGTFVNGRRVQSATLRDGDILRIGDAQGNSVSLTFRTARAAPVASTIRMGSTALGMKSSLVIGRNPQADVSLPSPIVSWHHARLGRTPRGDVLTDLNSTNGTFVNGRRLARPCLLQQGDVVQIGPFKLVYEASAVQQYAATGGVRLDGVRLTREVGRRARRKHILSDINISIYPREFVALVGASGAGKSTLLMALNGFTRAEGQVLINGDDLYQHFDLYRTLIGYVPQDDIIHKELTVASALRYAARLRLPPDTSAQEIKRRIDTVLQQVGMIGQRDQVVGSLSGGQRKRVSIAVELLAEPRVFFLDEPTSGLDPGLEKRMMHTLRRLADGGRTVVLVTHATANITQCDHVCFLSHGRMVYFGPPEEALQFFSTASDDFADIYAQLDVSDPQQAQQKTDQWERHFHQSPQYQQYVTERQKTLPQVQQKAGAGAAQRGPRVDFVQQFFVLTRRYLDLVFRDKLLLTVLLVVMPVIGLLLLLISGQNWLVGDAEAEIERQLAAELAAGESSATYAVVGDSQRLLFMMALAAVLLGIFAAAYEIVKERSIYRRERMVTLRLVPYLASKLVVLAVFALVQCLLLLLVIGLRVEMPGRGVLLPAPVEMYVTLIAGTLAAVMMGILISALVPNTNTVIYAVLLVLFFQIIFAGVIFDLPGAASELSALTLTRWTMEGLGTSANIERLNGLTCTRFQPDPITEEVSFDVEQPDPALGGTTVITKTVTITPEPVDIAGEREFQVGYTHTVGHLFCDLLILTGFGLMFGLGTVIVLKRRDRL
jgi:ABC-type multidrug transport system ATPase subunit/pSer/pThr/pTyr-binding forkhead associated (FHA) protein